MSPLEKDRSEGNVASWKNSAEMIEAPKLEVLRACWIKIKFSSSYLRRWWKLVSIYGVGGGQFREGVRKLNASP